jgi:HD-like signal output (HDOD) protein
MRRDDVHLNLAPPHASNEPTLQPELVAAAGPLPSPKGVALEIMRLTRRDDVTVLQIAQALRADPALSGRLLKTANSASNGARRPVASINDAVTVLGLASVRQLALGFSLISDYSSGGCARFDYQGFWSRSLLVALAAQGVARQTRMAAPDEMFACGLLADVGRLAFATLYPEGYGKLLDEADAQTDEDICALELERFGLNHVEMSAMMLHDWGLPELFVDAIRSVSGQFRGHDQVSERVRVIQGGLMLADALAAFCLSDAAHRRLASRSSLRSRWRPWRSWKKR